MVAPGFSVVKLALLSSLCAGCFYVGPLNERPSLDIRQVTETGGVVRRGDDLTVTAVVADAEGQEVALDWSAYACDDVEQCDPVAYATGTSVTFSARVPPFHGGGAVPTRHVLIILEGEDDRGAAARPAQQLVVPIADAIPTLRVSSQRPYDAVIGTPVDLFAEYGDADDGGDRLSIEWTVFSPGANPVELVPIEDIVQPTDPELRRAGMRLVPDVVGSWEIAVTVTDPLAQATSQQHFVQALEDLPPCLDTVSPAVPPDGVALPLAVPTLFQAAIVTDALDRFPSIPGDPLLGAPTFRWSLRDASGATIPIDATGASFALDPGSFPLGDTLALRLEVEDRHHTPIPCAAGDASCSIGANSCFQRRTWLVEVR
jgi:hypothetical protein